MEQILIGVINYIYMLGALAFVFEYLISRKKGEQLVLKLIDWSNYLSSKEIDNLISKVSLFFSKKYDKLYGEKYFGKKEWIFSSIIAFTYCYVFYLAERNIGLESTLAKQLGYWFIPNLVADIISINFTRWLLKKLYSHPEKYIQYLIYDIFIFIVCFYICFSFTIIYLSIFSELTFTRILSHPFYLFSTAIQNYPDPMAIDALFLLIMASTTFIPTFLHLIFIIFSILIKFLIPLLNVFTNNLIEKMISFERHPIGIAVILCGIFLLPFYIVYTICI